MRHDITEWLIHFVRDRNPEQDVPGYNPEEYGPWAGGELEPDASAFSVLQCVIRLGGLIAGHSFRNGRTTIYGGAPVVCVTEMPLYSFSQYARSLKGRGKASVYGVAFLKREFHAAGGRPVIYGLSSDEVRMSVNTNKVRMLDASILPAHEQFRYVAYNPAGDRWIDWSHEREWRWRPRDSRNDSIWCLTSEGYDFVPGLPLFRGPENGGHFSRLCIIVWDAEEAGTIQELLTGYYIAGGNNYDTQFSCEVLRRSLIITLEAVVAAVEGEMKLESQTIEGLDAAGFARPVIVQAISSEVKAVVEEAIVKARAAALQAAAEFMKSRDINAGYCAVANAVTYDIMSPHVQYLISAGYADGPYDGKVVVRLARDWPIGQSGDYEEAVMAAIACSLQDSLKVAFHVDSRPD